MLSSNALQLYLYVVGRDTWTVADASRDLGVVTRDVEAARVELRDRQLLVPIADGDDRLVANAPDVALAELVDDDERAIQDLRTRVTRHRSELMGLLPAYREARVAAESSPQVEVVEDPETIQRLLIDVGRRVTRDVLIAQPGSGYSVELHEESISKDRDLLAQGVRRRTIFHDRRVDHVPTIKTVAALEPLGAQFRTLPVVPLRVLIFDGALALVSRNQHPDDQAALVIRDATVVHTLVTLFETAWEVATPFRAGGNGHARGGKEEGHSLTAVQSAILAGLSAGLTDEAIATRLDISVRTCGRHIAAIFEALGAESRFQAGVLAVQRGWLTPRGRRG